MQAAERVDVAIVGCGPVAAVIRPDRYVLAAAALPELGSLLAAASAVQAAAA